MNPYASLAGQGYGEPQIMQEFGRSGVLPPREVGGMPMSMSGRMPPMMAPNPFGSSGMMGGGMNPMMSMGGPGAMGMPVEDFSQQSPLARPMPPTVYDPMPFIPGEVVVGNRIDEPRTVGSQYAGTEWAMAVKPYVTLDKFVEVPQTIMKESTRAVPKPEIVERIIEVPKMMYNERTVPAAKQVNTEEIIVEAPVRPLVEYRPPQRIPKTEIQERLIEIPKIEYRERIEYEDRIEYREVPVDKIVEVPQIEYEIRPVDRYVRQNYVKEYEIPRYTEVPVQQIQEVERIEHVEVINPIPRYQSVPVPVNVPVMSSEYPQIGPARPMMTGMSGFGPMPSGPMMSPGDAYARYDPMMMSGRMGAGPPPMSGMGMPMSGMGMPGMPGMPIPSSMMMGGMPPTGMVR